MAASTWREGPPLRHAPIVARQPDRLGWEGFQRARPERRPPDRLRAVGWGGGLLQLAGRAEGLASLLRHDYLGLRFQQERRSPADRGGMGIRRARRTDQSLLEFPVGQRSGCRQGQLAGVEESLPLWVVALDHAGGVL